MNKLELEKNEKRREQWRSQMSFVSTFLVHKAKREGGCDDEERKDESESEGRKSEMSHSTKNCQGHTSSHPLHLHSFTLAH